MKLFQRAPWASLVLVLSSLFSVQALADDPIYTSFFSSVAVSGYDSVAYFTEREAVKGIDQYSTQYKGANWHFSSQANLDLFKGNPEKYAPQYGGYCAWAVSNNYTAKGDPNQWAIHEGKLYLNYNSEIQGKWSADKEALIGKADGYWPTVLN